MLIMRLRRSLPALAASVVLAVPLLAAPPTQAAAPPSAERCAAQLNCTRADFNTLSAAERVIFVRRLQTRAAVFEPGFRRWAAIIGVMSAHRDHGLNRPNTWVAILNSNLLEGLERGVAVALDPRADTYRNPSAPTWARYLKTLRSNGFADQTGHDLMWSDGEQQALDHGDKVAKNIHHVQPTPPELRFKALTDLFRWSMRNEAAVQTTVGPLMPVYWWLVDVRNETPVRVATSIANVVLFGPPSPEATLALVRRLAPHYPGQLSPAAKNLAGIS